MASNKTNRRITVPKLARMKAAGNKISMLTAYDYPTAALLDSAGVDAILVGDSLSMVVQGHENTLPVTLDEMIYHAKMVGRAVQRAMVVVDLPFPTSHLGTHRAVEYAGRILKESRSQAVKLEGGGDQFEVMQALVAAGIPVMAHVGLRPQNVHALGGYRVQRDAEMLLQEAQAAEQAGAFSMVLECIPREIAADITAKVTIPTIGIGAGPDCDGQVLVFHDLIGLSTSESPKHAKVYAPIGQAIRDAAASFCEEVRTGAFPDDDHSFH